MNSFMKCKRNWLPDDVELKMTPLSDERAKMFVIATFTELKNDKDGVDPEIPELENHFLIQILNKRIEALKLPIKFSCSAKLAALALADRPGAMVALLIDCLNAHEGETITSGHLAELYPAGFYDEDSMCKYIDEYIKPRKIKWAEIY